MDYLLLKSIHILSSTLLFGTGLGSAFYKMRADRDGDLGAIVFASRNIVLADWFFTTPAIIVQPVTGLWMAFDAGYPLTSLWIIASIALYVLAGACWLPVVHLQMRMRDLAAEALMRGTPLPEAYHRYGRIWFWLGVPAFSAVAIVFVIMVIKPGLAG